MKTIITFLFIVIFIQFSHMNVSGSDAKEIVSEICFDEEEIYRAFTEIEELASYVRQNEPVAYADLIPAGFATGSLSHDASSDGPVYGFSFNNPSAFMMGCVFGTLGILAVAIINEGDRNSLNSALWGCAASGAVSVVSATAVYLLYLSPLLVFW
ncbi:MAG TPA: hypothetical protein PLK12_02530 [Prolixibacteraceae bacterium]|nr:hypothetical protein [Prolixibacteraceae bacterium]